MNEQVYYLCWGVLWIGITVVAEIVAFEVYWAIKRWRRHD